MSEEKELTQKQKEDVQQLIDDAYKRACSKALSGNRDGEEVLRLRREVESLKEERKNSAIMRILAKFGVHDQEDVVELIASRIDFDVNGYLYGVLNGEKKTNLEEYVADWLSERPHHLKPKIGVKNPFHEARKRKFSK